MYPEQAERETYLNKPIEAGVLDHGAAKLVIYSDRERLQLLSRDLSPGSVLQASEKAFFTRAGRDCGGVWQHPAGRQMAGRHERACG